MKEGRKILHIRNKLRLADREDWITAKEFKEDDLASDSDEEKKLKVGTSLNGKFARRSFSSSLIKV